MSSLSLEDECFRLDRRPYPAYKDLRGRKDRIGPIVLQFQSIQGDPFASPSRLKVTVEPRLTALPMWSKSSSAERVATGDFIHREMIRALGRMPRVSGSGKSGRVGLLPVGQEILDRSAVQIHEDGSLSLLMTVGLPAAGRRILGRAAATLLVESIPDAIRQGIEGIDWERLEAHIHGYEDQLAIRGALRAAELVAFVADDSVLPRISGVNDQPLLKGVPFVAPPNFRVTMNTPHSGPITGMGIPRGITLIVGGGYHGKSTLLQAIARGIYNHIPGDGRERVVTDRDSVWIRAEDGRSVNGVDLRPFITNLPLGRDTAHFHSADASGSTSQAAAVVEALEVGAKALLIDEDIAATNFMIRDARMRALIPPAEEPITPYLDRVESLFEEQGVSSILVVGGAGDYLSVANSVIQMESYQPRDVTERAREVVRQIPSATEAQSVGPWPSSSRRIPGVRNLNASRGRKRDRVRSMGTRGIEFGDEEIDLSLLEQLVDPAQARLIADILLALSRGAFVREAGWGIGEIVNEVDRQLEEEGILSISERGYGDRARPRKYEVAAALNRLRSLSFSGEPQGD